MSQTVRRVRSATLMLGAALLMALATGSPAGAREWAPQPVDTAEQGAFGFALMALMCGLIVASLFFMDRVRRKRTGEDK